MPAVDTRQLQTFTRTERLMGNRFALTLVHSDEAFAMACLNDAIAEIRRIEALLTTFREDSETARINANAGIRPVVVDEEVFRLIERCLRISQLTQGAFDISYGSTNKSFWNFDRSMTRLPDPKQAANAVRLINFRNVILNAEERTVFLKEKGMRIGFGGIGKGYAADRARYLLQAKGIGSGVVNAAGDLVAWGTQPNGSPWTIGIADPESRLEAFSTVAISDRAVATSGNYEKFVVIDGKRYSHTIDPRTGLPVTGIKSATIICGSGELADALATPVTVMGIRVGLDLVNQLPGVACILIDEKNRLHSSANIKIKCT